MREAARLQSFDDAFCFITSDEDSQNTKVGIGLDMIGEAVPPLLGEAFALKVACALETYYERQQSCPEEAYSSENRELGLAAI